MYNNLGVSLADYMNGSNDGNVLFDTANITAEQLANLSKAIEAREITGRETTDLTTASGAPLKSQSLEDTLKIITFKESDIQFWKRIPKLPAYNTVEEYNQLSSYGADRGGFNNEGELPEEEDSQYIRRAELVKFVGVTKSVTHPMQLVNINGFGPIMQREIKNGTLWILRKTDRALAFADSNIIPQEFNGYYAQHRTAISSNLNTYMTSNSVIDKRGKKLIETDVQKASQGIIENFGYANLMMAPPIVLTDYVEQYKDSKFIQPNTPGMTNGVIGQKVQQIQTQFGAIDLGYDIFLNSAPPRRTTDGATSPKAPATPTTPSSATPAVTPTFFTADVNVGSGDYFYAVAAVNRFGESALLSFGALITVATGDIVDLTFLDGAGPYATTGYVIYRSERSPATLIANTPLYPIFSVSVAQLTAGYDGAAAGSVRDRNYFIPNTSKAIVFQADEEVYSFKQLAPLMKMDLAILGPASRFMVLLYGTPQLYAPRKMTVIHNIGRFAN